MKWNRNEVRRLLDAELSEESAADGVSVHILRFFDHLMRYELWLSDATSSVFLAADAQTPIQGLPFFEISIPCTELAPHARDGMPVGLGIYSGAVAPPNLRFSITRRTDGNISLSGAYDGLTQPAPINATNATPVSSPTVAS